MLVVLDKNVGLRLLQLDFCKHRPYAKLNKKKGEKNSNINRKFFSIPNFLFNIPPKLSTYKVVT